MTRFETTTELLAGILEGQVPRQVRLFAAQGLLPISREDLLRLQVMLSSDPDEELAKIAKASVLEVGESAIVEWLASYQLEPMVLDLLIRLREEDAVWVGVARHAAVSDETLRVLAKNGSSVVQDIIMTNQVRIFGCLEILEDLRNNSRVTENVLRRVSEFEHEFIAKAIAAEEALAAEDTPTIEHALESLRSIGAHIPELERLPYLRSDDAGVREAVGNAGGTQSTFARLVNMSIKDKVICALKGSREERAILINSRNRLVVRGVLGSPKLSDAEVEKFAGLRTVDSEVLRVINRNPRWMRRYQVVWQLVSNPKTPVDLGMRLINRLNVRDLKRISSNRNINPVIRRIALTSASRRR
jgi:hypothetical protein